MGGRVERVDDGGVAYALVGLGWRGERGWDAVLVEGFDQLA